MTGKDQAIVAGILFTAVVILTRCYTWSLNYMAKPVRSVQIERPVAFTVFAIQIILFVWRITVLDLLTTRVLQTPKNILIDSNYSGG